MALEKRSLALHNSTPYGTAGAQVNWYHYATTDAVATVITAGYFNDLRGKLKVNDVIEAMCVAGGVGDRVVLKVTAAPATGNVTVANDPAAAAA